MFVAITKLTVWAWERLWPAGIGIYWLKVESVLGWRWLSVSGLGGNNLCGLLGWGNDAGTVGGRLAIIAQFINVTTSQRQTAYRRDSGE